MTLKHVLAAVNSCIMLHNMMVVERVHDYDLVMDPEVGGNAPAEDEATQFVNVS
jgi:hypothetical protein